MPTRPLYSVQYRTALSVVRWTYETTYRTARRADMPVHLARAEALDAVAQTIATSIARTLADFGFRPDPMLTDLYGAARTRRDRAYRRRLPAHR